MIKEIKLEKTANASTGSKDKQDAHACGHHNCGHWRNCWRNFCGHR